MKYGRLLATASGLFARRGMGSQAAKIVGVRATSTTMTGSTQATSLKRSAIATTPLVRTFSTTTGASPAVEAKTAAMIKDAKKITLLHSLKILCDILKADINLNSTPMLLVSGYHVHIGNKGVTDVHGLLTKVKTFLDKLANGENIDAALSTETSETLNRLSSETIYVKAVLNSVFAKPCNDGLVYMPSEHLDRVVNFAKEYSGVLSEMVTNETSPGPSGP